MEKTEKTYNEEKYNCRVYVEECMSRLKKLSDEYIEAETEYNKRIGKTVNNNGN